MEDACLFENMLGVLNANIITHTHTQTDTRIYIHIHAHAHAHSYILIHTYTHTPTANLHQIAPIRSDYHKITHAHVNISTASLNEYVDERANECVMS